MYIHDELTNIVSVCSSVTLVIPFTFSFSEHFDVLLVLVLHSFVKNVDLLLLLVLVLVKILIYF